MLSAIASALVGVLAAPPAGAAPGDSVPDSGSSPTFAGPLQLPGQAGPAGPSSGQNTIPGSAVSPVLGPLGTQIAEEGRNLESIWRQLQHAETENARATTAKSKAEAQVRRAEERLQELLSQADAEASNAYKQATELGPFDSYADELHRLSRIAPGLGAKPGGEALPRDVLKAEKELREAREAYQRVDETSRTNTGNRDSLQTQYTTKLAALNDLTSRNAAALAQVNAERDRYEQSLGGSNLSEISIDGKAADPRALAAAVFALSQQGKPYVFGAQGPNSYDCSGLVLASYLPYRQLPRIADDQYRATKAIKASKHSTGDLLLPGDLLFFSQSGGDWTTIHHVGIYIGGGRMVHAPMPGDVVRVAPVWWSAFFGATRVFDAVEAPHVTPPTPPAPPNTGGPSSPEPSKSPDPSPTPPSPSPSPSPSTTPPTTPPPSSSEVSSSQQASSSSSSSN